MKCEYRAKHGTPAAQSKSCTEFTDADSAAETLARWSVLIRMSSYGCPWDSFLRNLCA